MGLYINVSLLFFHQSLILYVRMNYVCTSPTVVRVTNKEGVCLWLLSEQNNFLEVK